MGIEEGKNAQILKNVLYIADYMNRLSIKHTNVNAIKARRNKTYEA